MIFDLINLARADRLHNRIKHLEARIARLEHRRDRLHARRDAPDAPRRHAPAGRPHSTRETIGWLLILAFVIVIAFAKLGP